MIEPARTRSLAGALVGGYTVIAFLVLAIVVWGVSTEIAGAVIARGTVVVETSHRPVQHPTGGVVAEVRVRDGDRVRRGDLLIALDATLARSALRAIVRQLDELAVREARLVAERDGTPHLALPADLDRRVAVPDIAELVDTEARLLASRRALQLGQRQELERRRGELAAERAGLSRQLAAKAEEMQLIGEEIELLERSGEGNSSGARQHEISQPAARDGEAGRLLSLRREAARLGGEHARLKAALAQLGDKIAAIDLEMRRIEDVARNEVLTELAAVRSKMGELSERRTAAEVQVSSAGILAPVDGTVHELAVRGAGAVVGAGERLLELVPDGDRLVVDAGIDPRDIDRVLASKTVRVRLEAADRATTPDLEGRLTRVSADLTRDRVTGASAFIVRVEIAPQELARLAERALVPGMPVEVLIETEARTPLSYLAKPLSDQISKAWRER
jgi:HlyD family secretion protein